MSFIIDFITKFLTKIIIHRNHLKHYQNTIHQSERPVQHRFDRDRFFWKSFSPHQILLTQSFHWSHQQISPFWFDEISRAEVIPLIIVTWLKRWSSISGVCTAWFEPKSTIILEKDNYSSQHKSCQNYERKQKKIR